MNHPRHPDFPQDDHDDEWGSSLTGSGEFQETPSSVPRWRFLSRQTQFSLLDGLALGIIAIGAAWGAFSLLRYFLPLLLALFFGV